MAEAALKIEAPYITLRRVGLPDLAEKGRFLCQRIKQHKPHLQDMQIMTMLNQMTGDNHCFFVRYDDAVGLFRQERDPLIDAHIRLRTIFVLCDKLKLQNDKHVWEIPENAEPLRQGANLYADARRYAETINAASVDDLDHMSDVPLGIKNSAEAKAEFPHTIRSRIGPMRETRMIFSRLEAAE